MTSRISTTVVRFALVSSIALSATTVGAQITETELHRLLGSESWSADNRANLEKGEPVVYSLETKDKQELATIGFVRIKSIPAVTMDMFRRSMDQKSEGAVQAGGRLSQPPGLDDLKNLDLDEATIGQLRTCAIKDCDLNLSAEAIGRFRSIDWDSPEANRRAVELMRAVLVENGRAYWSGGIGALGRYDNRRKPVDLTAAHRTLLQSSSLIDQIAPEFIDYLGRFPDASLSNVENTLHWSVVDFGLKPSITISHAAAFSRNTDRPEQFFVASRQIYSSRYLDTSLSFAVFLRTAGDESGDTAYLLFLDRSRSDALDGPLGSLARAAVRNEASERVREMLDKAHIRLLTFARPSVQEDGEGSTGILERLSWSAILVLAIVAVALLIIAYRFLRRRS